MGYSSKLLEGTILGNPVDVLCVGVIDVKDLVDVTVMYARHASTCGQLTAQIFFLACRDQIERLDQRI